MVFNTTFNNISGNCSTQRKTSDKVTDSTQRKTSDKVTDKNYDIMLYGVHPTRVAFELTMH
jgi:hypothetical protein